MERLWSCVCILVKHTTKCETSELCSCLCVDIRLWSVDKYCKGRVPVVYVVDREMATVVMEDLREYIILRKGSRLPAASDILPRSLTVANIQGIRRGKSYPCVASHIAQFMAKTLFKSCDFGMQPSEKRQLMAIFAGMLVRRTCH